MSKEKTTASQAPKPVPERSSSLSGMGWFRRQDHGIPLVYAVDEDGVLQAALLTLCKLLDSDCAELRVTRVNIPVNVSVLST